MDTPLRLTASLEDAIFRLGQPIPVRLELINVSSEPVWINKRMSVGYEDGFTRELFFCIYDASTGNIIPAPENERVDAHRLPPTREDFRLLGSGEACDTVIDVYFWHRFARSGSYRIVFTYDNQYDGHEFGLRAFTGSIESNPLLITIES